MQIKKNTDELSEFRKEVREKLANRYQESKKILTQASAFSTYSYQFNVKRDLKGKPKQYNQNLSLLSRPADSLFSNAPKSHIQVSDFSTAQFSPKSKHQTYHFHTSADKYVHGYTQSQGGFVKDPSINQLKHDINLFKRTEDDPDRRIQKQKISLFGMNHQESPLKNKNNSHYEHRKRNIQDILSQSKLNELTMFLETATQQDIDNIPYGYTAEFRRLARYLNAHFKF